VPCTAGSQADLLARRIAKRMSQNWEQDVLVENVPLADCKYDANSKWIADGRTIVFDCGDLAHVRR
jgi:tripartite-type tricarboxylate transporter receptor subunit TctC